MNDRARQNAGGFSITEVKCPSCGGPVQLPDEATSVTCAFCGSVLHVSYSQPVDAGIDPDGTMRDRTTGYGLFRGNVPKGWAVAGTALQHTNTLSRPYVPQVELQSITGAIMRIRQGEAGTRESAGMSAINAMYGQAAAPYDTSNYAEMPNPIAVADSFASTQVAGLGGQGLAYEGQALPRTLGDAERRAAEHYTAQARAAGIAVSGFLGAQVLRTYSFAIGAEPWKMAVFVEAWGAKGGLGGIGNVADQFTEGIGGIAGAIGGLFGGLQNQGAQARMSPGNDSPAGQPAGRAQSAGGMFKSALEFGMGGGLIGKKMREARASYSAQPQTAAAQSRAAALPCTQQGQQPMPLQAQPKLAEPQGKQQWCSADFAAFNQGGTVYWSIDRMASLIAPEAQFEERYSSDFLPFIASTFVHPDVHNLEQAEANQTNAAIQANTQTALAQSNARFAAQQAAHRQRQAAFNSYNDSITAARDSRQASFRAATNAQFATSPAGGGHTDFSEAIRGVNTFVTSDGREVELSVRADVAYENQAGDVIGGSSGFDPGADWTQISRT